MRVNNEAKPKKLPIVHCRICKGDIDRNCTLEERDWFERASGWYYHKKCYDEWQTKKDDIRTDTPDLDLWKDATYQYLRRDLKIVVNWEKFNSQFTHLLNKGRTAKGIYFAVRYFYEIEKGDREKAQGGIGIVDHIYARSTNYWAEKQRNGENILKQIEQQIKEQREREVVIVPKHKKKKKSKITLDMVEEYDND